MAVGLFEERGESTGFRGSGVAAASSECKRDQFDHRETNQSNISDEAGTVNRRLVCRCVSFPLQPPRVGGAHGQVIRRTEYQSADFEIGATSGACLPVARRHAKQPGWRLEHQRCRDVVSPSWPRFQTSSPRKPPQSDRQTGGRDSYDPGQKASKANIYQIACANGRCY